VRVVVAGQSGAALALMVLTFIFFWFVCGLSGFHTWLVATNQTTYENFRWAGWGGVGWGEGGDCPQGQGTGQEASVRERWARWAQRHGR
jgi:hypothetical protein